MRLCWIALFVISVLGPTALGAEDKPEQAKVVAFDKLNTKADEDDPCLAPGGMALFYASNAGGDFDLMVATRKTKDGPFAFPHAIEELNGKGDDLSPFPLPRERDGSEYVYLAKRTADAKNFDIYFTRRLKPSEPYQRIALAPVHQICTPADELHPWLSADLKELYFSRKTADGWRIGWAHGRDPRAFETVSLLELPVGYHHPSLTKDMLTMYLQGPVEEDRQGLFVTKRTSKSAPWSTPQPLKGIGPRDGKKGDVSPSVAPDGAALYFASDRSEGQGGLDLYYVSLSELRRAGN